jgi:hypothetical protein
MSDSGYKGGGTRRGRWDCALAALFGIPVAMLATLAASLGDCMPDVGATPASGLKSFSLPRW